MNKSKIDKRLITLYPTKEVMEKLRENYTSWKHMAKANGFSQFSFDKHRKSLGVGKDIAGKKPKEFSDLTMEEIYDNIQTLVGKYSKDVYSKYLIIDAELFYKNQIGYEGLKFIGIFKGEHWQSQYDRFHLHAGVNEIG